MFDLFAGNADCRRQIAARLMRRRRRLTLAFRGFQQCWRCGAAVRSVA